MSEAQRIRLAHLFDRVLAVHTSVVEPLPHLNTAVYESMLLRQPLCFLIADDPGMIPGAVPGPVPVEVDPPPSVTWGPGPTTMSTLAASASSRARTKVPFTSRPGESASIRATCWPPRRPR